jgi:hypothetical protein
MEMGGTVSIAEGQYKVISFDGQDRGHTEKHPDIAAGQRGALMQYVDYPEDCWNVFVKVIDTEGCESYAAVAVPASSIERVLP